MTTIFELTVGLLAIAGGIWFAWDAWREQRREETRRHRWEVLATQLDRYREYFQGDFPKNVTIPDGDGKEKHFEIHRAEPSPAQPADRHGQEDPVLT